MTTLYIDRKGAEIDVENDTVVVRIAGERCGTVPLKPLERVVVFASAKLSTRCLARLAENGTGLLIISGSKRAASATLMGQPRGDVELRMAQYAFVKDEPLRAHLSRGLVTAKITAQLALLRRAEESRGRSLALSRAIETLTSVLDNIATAPASRARLRGLEGGAAAGYFTALTTLFPASLRFDKRSRRPPRDPVNACLSLGYTLLHFEAVREAVAHGLDPMVGAYHDLTAGRESLACDFSEPLRPAVDRFVLALFIAAKLRAEDFSTSEAQGCRLKKEARRDFYAAYEQDEAPIHRPMLAQIAQDFARALATGTQSGGMPAIAAQQKAPNRDQ
jgi:CRISP-associated protein Cas1